MNADAENGRTGGKRFCACHLRESAQPARHSLGDGGSAVVVRFPLGAETAGFTLIELLVVIAIISLLVSILLPSLTRARSMTKNVMCQCNLRNLYLGFWQYADDFGGRLPPCSGRGEGCGWEDGYGFLDGLYPDYVDTPGVYFCPDTALDHLKGPNASFPHQDSNYYYRYQLYGDPAGTSGLNHYYTIDRTPRFAVMGDKYTSSGTTFELVNHTELVRYNGLMSTGEVVSVQGPLSGWCGGSTEIVGFGLYWQIIESR